jgi:hypothetical protein
VVPVSADTWRVEVRGPHQMAWSTYVDRLPRSVALETAEVVRSLHPEWTLRLVDDATAEIVRLGSDGRPITDGVMVADRRSPEEVLADLAADRAEAALDRQWGDR